MDFYAIYFIIWSVVATILLTAHYGGEDSNEGL